MAKSKPYLEEVAWEQVRHDVLTVCPELSSILDETCADKQFKLIRARYPFGSLIVENGVLNIPTETGNLASVLTSKATLGRQLAYSPVPIGIITKNCAEVYLEMEHRIFSIAYFNHGMEIGIWEYFNWETPYNVSAGARSLYLIPKVTQSSKHKKLKMEFGVTVQPPKTAFDNWDIFKQIASSPEFSEEWYCEIIYLPKNLFEALNKKYEKFHNYLLQKGWNHSAYARAKSILDVLWQLFVKELSEKGVKINPYVIDTLKHLIFISSGQLPGCIPTTGNDQTGPLTAIQKIYIEFYGLDYIPTIMEPAYLQPMKNNVVYYSLQSPTLLESVPKSKNLTSIIDNIRELKDTIDLFLNVSFNKNIKFADTSVHDIIKRITFDFFHSESFAYGQDIKSAKKLIDADPRFLYTPLPSKKLHFSEFSPYLHGCIRINNNI